MSNYSDSAFTDQDSNTSWYKALELIPTNAKVLDIGCSSGNFGTELIKRKQCTVDGIEINPDDLKQAKKKLRRVYRINIESDSLEPIKDKYDVIYFGDVIEHLVDPAATLKRIKRLLAADGKVLFSIPNMAYVGIRLLLLKGDFDYTETGLLDQTHLHYYSLDEVYRVFGEAGYCIDHIDFVAKDYPKAVIEDWLDGIGLKPSEKFYELMSRPEASAFQFVGTAQFSQDAPKADRAHFGPVDLYEAYHNHAVIDLEAKISQLERKNTELAVEHEVFVKRWELLKKNPIVFGAKSLKNKVKRKLK